MLMKTKNRKKKMRKMYMVVARFAMDDIPLLITPRKREAIRLYDQIEAPGDNGNEHPVVKRSILAACSDASAWCCPDIWQFDSAGQFIG